MTYKTIVIDPVQKAKKTEDFTETENAGEKE